VKLLAAAIQMPSTPGEPAANLDRADVALNQARQAGASLAVLPEMVHSGYGLLPCYNALAEPIDGPFLSHLRERARVWQMMIAAGFVESDGPHLYDSLALVQPDGRTSVYRKRNLVFWERFRFLPGRTSTIVSTPFGRVGLAICADMIYRKVWSAYRDRVDLAVIASAWPDFACRETGRKHWLFGHLGPLAATIPGRVAADLKIPVVFANQCGDTRTVIPMVSTWITEKLADRFAGRSCVADGAHGAPRVAGTGEEVLLSEITVHTLRGPRSWRSTSPSGFVASSSGSEPSGLASTPSGSTAKPAASAL